MTVFLLTHLGGDEEQESIEAGDFEEALFEALLKFEGLKVDLERTTDHSAYIVANLPLGVTVTYDLGQEGT